MFGLILPAGSLEELFSNFQLISTFLLLRASPLGEQVFQLFEHM
jgi:hypothetical protein